jgi:hypothetical protein
LASRSGVLQYASVALHDDAGLRWLEYGVLRE